MKTFAYILCTATLLAASGALAEEAPHAATPAAAPSSAPATPQATPVQQAEQTAAAFRGEAGEFCSKDNPYMEYRDCVNASTRNPNAKVRMG